MKKLLAWIILLSPLVAMVVFFAFVIGLWAFERFLLLVLGGMLTIFGAFLLISLCYCIKYTFLWAWEMVRGRKRKLD